jgi:hypothetical protein
MLQWPLACLLCGSHVRVAAIFALLASRVVFVQVGRLKVVVKWLLNKLPVDVCQLLNKLAGHLLHCPFVDMWWVLNNLVVVNGGLLDNFNVGVINWWNSRCTLECLLQLVFLTQALNVLSFGI